MEKNVSYNIDILTEDALQFKKKQTKKTIKQTCIDRFQPLFKSA